jgi:hypothetical protein
MIISNQTRIIDEFMNSDNKTIIDMVNSFPFVRPPPLNTAAQRKPTTGFHLPGGILEYRPLAGMANRFSSTYVGE